MTFIVVPEVQNAMLAGFKQALGTGAILRLYAGATLLASVVFAGEWLSVPANGGMSLIGVPASNPTANESGVPDTGRFFKADGATLMAEASVSGFGGNGVIKLSNPIITKGEAVVVVQLTFAMPNGA